MSELTAAQQARLNRILSHGGPDTLHCSICGQPCPFPEHIGPGPHVFHGVCVNGADNLAALLVEVGGGPPATRLAWPAAEANGITYPWPPFTDQQ